MWLFVPTPPSKGAEVWKAGAFSELYHAISGRISTVGENQCCQPVA